MPHNTSNPRKWWVLIAVSISLAMIFLDQSALPIALPTIQKNMQVSQNGLGWIINAYILTIATLLILGGKVADALGHRRVFISGMVLFVLSSIACGLASNVSWLIIGRIAQGIGAAFMLPASNPLLRSVVAGKQFGRISGIYVSIASIFLILGPSIGGILTEHLSWRWIFWINAPLAILSIAMVLYYVPSHKPPLTKKPIDWLGFISLSLCLIGLVFGVMQANIWGWASIKIFSSFAISFIAGAICFRTAQKHPNPFLNINLFKNSHFLFSTLVVMLLNLICIGSIYWALFLQYVLKFSATKAGMLMLLVQAPILLISPIGGRLLDHFGPRMPSILGIILVMMSMSWVAIFSWTYNFWWLFPGFLFVCIGAPLANIANLASVVETVTIDKRAIAAATVNTSRQVGGTIGLALTATIIAEISHWQLKSKLMQGGNELAQIPANYLDSIFDGIYPSSLSPAAITALEKITAHAYTLGFSIAMGIAALLCIFTLWAAKNLPNQPVSEEKKI